MEITGSVNLAEKFTGALPADADQDAFIKEACTRMTDAFLAPLQLRTTTLTLIYSTISLPSWNAGVVPANSPLDAEEERRLAYVAVTRAQHHLIIQHAEDPLLSAWVDQYEDFPQASDGIRKASPYLFEGELGISMRVAEAVRDGVQDRITLRNPRVAQRYLKEKGMADLIQIETLPHLAALSAGTPLTDVSMLKPGVHVWSRDRGTCEVISRVGTSAAFHIRLPDGTTTYEVLTEGGNWMVL